MIDVLAAAIIEKKGKIVMVKEDDGDWNFPTGHVEPDEDVFEAAKREIKEETGYDAELTGILKIYEYFKGGKNKLRITFTADAKGEKREPNEEIIEIKEFSPEEIESMPDESFRNKHTKEMVRDYLKKKTYPLDMIKMLR